MAGAGITSLKLIKINGTTRPGAFACTVVRVQATWLAAMVAAHTAGAAAGSDEDWLASVDKAGGRLRARDPYGALERAPSRRTGRRTVESPYPSDGAVERIETACPPQIVRDRDGNFGAGVTCCG